MFLKYSLDLQLLKLLFECLSRSKCIKIILQVSSYLEVIFWVFPNVSSSQNHLLNTRWMSSYLKIISWLSISYWFILKSFFEYSQMFNYLKIIFCVSVGSSVILTSFSECSSMFNHLKIIFWVSVGCSTVIKPSFECSLDIHLSWNHFSNFPDVQTSQNHLLDNR